MHQLADKRFQLYNILLELSFLPKSNIWLDKSKNAPRLETPTWHFWKTIPSQISL